MAASNFSRPYTKLLVQGIPSDVSVFKLEAYFQKKKHGGGEITCISYPKSLSEPNSAVIEFENAEVASRVLSRQHQIHKTMLNVERYPPEIFKLMSINLDPNFLAYLQSHCVNLEKSLTEIHESSGAMFMKDDYGGLLIKGSWSQICCAHDLLYKLRDTFKKQQDSISTAVSSTFPRKSSKTKADLTSATKRLQPSLANNSTPPTMTSHSTSISRKSTKTNTDVNMPGSLQHKTPVKSQGASGSTVPDGENVIVDVNFYAYTKKFYNEKLLEIWRMYHVEVREVTICEMLKIMIRPTSNPRSDIKGAVHKMNQFCEKIKSKLRTDEYIIDSRVENRVEEVLSQVMSTCSGVYLALDSVDQAKVKIYSNDETKCDTAKTCLKVCCDNIMASPSKQNTSNSVRAKQSTGTGSPSSKANVDVSVFIMPHSGIRLKLVHGDISTEQCDYIVNTANAKLLPGLGVSGAIFKRGGQELSSITSQIMSSRKRNLSIGEMVETKATGDLKCKTILHVLGPVWSRANTTKLEHALYNLIKDIFKHVFNKAKTIAIPAICTGAHGYPMKVFCQQFVKALKQSVMFTNPAMLTLQEIRIVLYMKKDVGSVQSFFDLAYNNSPASQSAVSGYGSQLGKGKSFDDNKDNNNKLYDFDPPTKQKPSSGRNSPSISKASNLAANFSNQTLPECPICLDDLDSSDASNIKSLPCGCSNSTFHKMCINMALKTNNKCPSCNFILGAITGNQPPGTMNVSKEHFTLPGYENYGRIRIQYSFQSGDQSHEHPHPGRRYHGTSRTAYLPDNDEGNYVLSLLKKAFDARLVFTVGQSATTGMDDSIIWADIHHKTSATGGPQRFGYPDPTYLCRVRNELRDRGIV